MKRERILLCKPKMSGRELDFIKPALAEDWAVPMGPDVNEFERELERLTGCADKRVVALSSGTAALHLALIACGVGPGDEVIVQSMTFCASTNPVAYLGAIPVFVDSERETWNMDPDLLEEAIKDRMAKTGRKPKAIIPVALYGMPYQIERIMEIADRYGIPVIEDAAEGFCSRYDGKLLGTFGRFGALSFNGNKMITTSGGGALICPDEATAQKIKWYATQARESYPYYQHEAVGYNYRLSNISACIGRAQLTVLDEHLEHHKRMQRLYCELLNGVEGFTMHSAPTLLPPHGGYDSNYWLCTAIIDPEARVKGEDEAYSSVISGAVGGAAGVTHTAASATTDCQPNNNVEAMRVWLDKANIEARPLWKPMHRQPVFRNSPAIINGVSEQLFHTGICLPAGPYVTDDDVRYIVDCIKAGFC
ncbi:MAG: aminotransferase class I/II-fold pyridoxal phosphate-dependent enzyme [Bacteroidales bacterium]|nr:aminotransferase class I/II-fold pyridoxal phosphate-dependent enzyme [Bacteroidales bacterium]